MSIFVPHTAFDRPRDHDSPSGPQLDHSTLLGSWRNADQGSFGGVLQFVVSEVDGALRVGARGASPSQPYDWGQVPARTYAESPESRTAFSFFAVFDLGFMSTVVTAYVKVGILVVTTFNAFTDPRDRASYWTREFFYRDPDPVPAGRAPVGGLSRQRDRGVPGGHRTGGRIEIDPLIAVWRNFNPAAKEIGDLVVTAQGDGFVITPSGQGTERSLGWATSPGVAFTDDAASSEAVGFTTSFDLSKSAGRYVDLVGYLNHRLLTLESGTTLVDGSGRSDYFNREHFYPVLGNGKAGPR